MAFSEYYIGEMNVQDVTIGGIHHEQLPIPISPTLFTPGVRWFGPEAILPTDIVQPKFVATILTATNTHHLPFASCGGYVFLAKEPTPRAAHHYSIPAGGIEFGESPEEAAAREIREETGFETITSLEQFGAFVVPEMAGMWPAHSVWLFTAQTEESIPVQSDNLFLIGPANFADLFRQLGPLDELADAIGQRIPFGWQRETTIGASIDFSLRNGSIVREIEYHD